MHERPPPGRPRPVADPVVDALVQQADEVAQRWLLALMESAPLALAGRVPVDELASDGPAFCAAVLGAARSDAALSDLLDAGDSPSASDLARLSGAPDGPAAVAAAEALRRAIRDAAAGEVPHAEAGVLADLGDRLAHVCSLLVMRALDEGRAGSRPGPVRDRPRAVDPDVPEGGVTPHPLRRWTDDAGAGAEAARSGDSAPLWRAALDRQVADGVRFALFLVELDGADRLLAAEGEEAARELFAQAARAVRGCVRRADLLAHEEDGRMWVIAADAARGGAASLAERVADAIEGAASAHGAPLTASIGVAMFPDDGRDAEELAARAEEAAYAARAAGVRVTGPPDEPVADGPRAVS